MRLLVRKTLAPHVLVPKWSLDGGTVLGIASGTSVEKSL